LGGDGPDGAAGHRHLGLKLSGKHGRRNWSRGAVDAGVCPPKGSIRPPKGEFVA